jgi:predicted dehydrogenase
MCTNNSDPDAHAWAKAEIPDVETSFRVDDLLAREDIDAVIIATPSSTHVDLAIRAMEAGKHVLVEKPLTTALDEVTRVEEVAEATGRHLIVGYTFLYHPVAAEIGRRTESDPLVEMNTSWTKWGSFEEPLTWNLLIHHVALFLRLLGDQLEFASWGPVLGAGVVTELDRLEAHLEVDETIARFHVDRAAPARGHSLSFRSESGELLVWEGEKLSVARGDELQELFQAKESALDVEIREFLGSIDGPASEPDVLTRHVTTLLEALEDDLAVEAES